MSARRSGEFDMAALKWATAIAEAISSVGPPPNQWDIADIHLLFDGEFTGLGVGGSEFGEEYVVIPTERIERVEARP